MEIAEVEIYSLLLETRQNVKAAYYDNLRNLKEIKAPREWFDKLFDEADSVLKKLDEYIEAHPLHRK